MNAFWLVKIAKEIAKAETKKAARTGQLHVKNSIT
jgi:hypothetical protein